MGAGIGGIGFGLITPVTVILLEQNKTPSWITGSATMIGYISLVLFSSYAGRLISKIHLKKVLIIGLVLWTIGAVAHVFWYIYPLLYLIKFVMGIGGTFVFVSTEVAVNYYCSDFNRGKYIGLYVLLLSVGIAAGTMLIWTIKFGDWVPFVIGGAIMFVVLVLQALLFEEIKIEIHNPLKQKFTLRDMPLISLITAALYGVFEASVIVAVPLYGLRNGFSQDNVSWFLASFVLGGVIFSYALNRYSDKVPKLNLILKLAFSLAMLFLIPLFTKNFWTLLVSFFILGGIIPSLYTIGLSHTIEKVEQKFISNANGYYIMMYGIGTIAGPITASLLIEIDQNVAYWVFSSALCFIFILFFRKLKK